ncbi:MAG: hypothetical protein EBQ96_09250 [Proteobacteria bacterium]|nr:hypothetical protein [Pseudomonadota bacterium]
MSETDEAGVITETVEDRLRETANWSRGFDIDGAAAWNALHQYQTILIEATWPIDADESYKIGGFESYADFQRIMSNHAMDEARRLYDTALDKLGRDVDDVSFVPTMDTMDQLPYLDMKAALDWIKKSGRPLLADATYEVIGSTRTDFFDEMRLAHISAARLKIGNAAVWEGDPESGIAIVESALRHNFSALGLNANSPDIAKYIDLDAVTIRAVHGNHVTRKFKAQMALIAGWRQFKKTDAPEYHDAMIEAAITLGRSEALNEDPEIYKDIGFTRDAFEAEVHRCAECKLARIVSGLTTGEVTGEFLQDQLEAAKNLRKLFSFVKAPDDTPLDYIGEDYWCANILQQFGFRSYSHFAEQLSILGARAIINNTLYDSKMGPLDRHDDLAEAVAMLKDARYPVNDTAALDAIEVDRKTLTETFVTATYPAAQRDWNILGSDTFDTTQKMQLIQNLRDSQNRLREAGTEDKLPFTAEALNDAEDQINLRYAEEVIADFLVALDTPNGYETLRKAYQVFDDLEVDLLKPDVHRPMGMNAAFAEYIDDRFGMMEMADIWVDATDEELPLVERFEAVTSFTKKMETLDAEQVDRLTRHLGLETPPASGVLAQDIALNLYHEMLELFDEYGDDPVKGYEYLRIASECLTTIDPNALTDEKAFRAITGKIGCRVFVRQLESLKARAEAINRPLSLTFNSQGAESQDIVSALKPENKGRKAYDLIEEAARNLRQHGKSILDESILGPLGMTPETMVAFLDEQALIVAREHADTARASKGFPVTLQTIQDHPYQHFRHALSCLSRHSKGTVLSDDLWDQLGFAGREDFMDQCREALLDVTTQMEQLASSPQSMQMGPFGFLRLLSQIRACNRALGIESKDDIPDLADLIHTTGHGGAIETTQRAIHRMAHAACQQVLREEPPVYVARAADGSEIVLKHKSNGAGPKFKRMKFIYDFAQEMRTMTWEAGGKIGNTNAAYDELIQQRVEGVVNAFEKRKGDPGRGVRLALALKDMADRYQLREDVWFQYLFMGMNYRDFDAFCDYAALQRMRQIVDRTKNTMMGMKGDEQINPTTHLFMLRDMMRIENMASSDGLLSERRRDDILDELGVDPEWHRLQMAISAQFAIPLMLREAADPTLEDAERWTIIEEAIGVLKLIGRARTKHIEIDKKSLAMQRTRAVERMAALNLVEDMLRIETDTVSQHVHNAANVLGLLQRYFHDEGVAQGLGLKPDEIARLVKQEQLLPAYTLARNLYEVPAADLTAQYVVITQLYECFGYAQLDPHNADHLKSIAIKKPLEFMAKLDAMTLQVLKGSCEDLPKLEGRPSKQVETLNLILRFIETTDIESRASKEDLGKLGIMTHDEVVKAITQTVPKTRVAARASGAAAAAHPAMM